MAFKHEELAEWVATTLPGERLVSYAVAASGVGNVTIGTGGSARTSSVTGAGLRSDLARRLGLDPAKSMVWKSNTFYVLTDRQLALGSRSAMRNRPKDLVHAAPLDGVRVHWFDYDAGAGNRHRHFVTDFGDGFYRSDETGLAALGREITTGNSDAFLAALGDRAIEVTDLR